MSPKFKWENVNNMKAKFNNIFNIIKHHEFKFILPRNMVGRLPSTIKLKRIHEPGQTLGFPSQKSDLQLRFYPNNAQTIL